MNCASQSIRYIDNETQIISVSAVNCAENTGGFDKQKLWHTKMNELNNPNFNVGNISYSGYTELLSHYETNNCSKAHIKVCVSIPAHVSTARYMEFSVDNVTLSNCINKIIEAYHNISGGDLINEFNYIALIYIRLHD